MMHLGMKVTRGERIRTAVPVAKQKSCSKVSRRASVLFCTYCMVNEFVCRPSFGPPTIGIVFVLLPCKGKVVG